MNETFRALLEEATFTKEILASGVTQIRKANYTRKGVYFQCFTNLSTVFIGFSKTLKSPNL